MRSRVLEPGGGGPARRRSAPIRGSRGSEAGLTLRLFEVFLRTKETLLLDLRSCERALQAIPFFDTHLPRKLAELEDAEVVNRLFPANETNLKLTPDALFDPQIGTGIDPEAL